MDPLHLRPLEPRAELLFLTRALEFFDLDFYVGGHEDLITELFGKACHFLKCFSVARKDEQDKPQLILHGGTTQQKFGMHNSFKNSLN